jgi:hypothetical protein
LVAFLNYFVAPNDNIPPLSLIGATIHAHAAEITELQTKLAAQVLVGKITHDQALGLLGAKVVAMVQARLASNIPPPLKPATIKRKKSSVALIDTGQLRSAVTWKVE